MESSEITTDIGGIHIALKWLNNDNIQSTLYLVLKRTTEFCPEILQWPSHPDTFIL